MILVKTNGYMSVTMAKYTPRRGRQGSRSRVQIIAPRRVAMGMVKTSGTPNEVFRMAARYPPVPMKKAPPRETKPTKWARKSKLKARSE
jgi:hypothetical protein